MLSTSASFDYRAAGRSCKRLTALDLIVKLNLKDVTS
jgi:hypothetical protein